MALDSETDALIRPDSREVEAADDNAPLWAPKGTPAGYKAMPVSFFASCAMAATAASTVYAYAHILCKDASQCADGEKAAYASAVAVATTLANVCGLMAVGIYERLPTRAGLAVWIGLRAGSVVVLGAGGKAATTRRGGEIRDTWLTSNDSGAEECRTRVRSAPS